MCHGCCVLLLPPHCFLATRLFQPEIGSQGTCYILWPYLCFLPEVYCETNFIEMYGGTAKLQYCLSSKTANMDEMGKNVQQCLNHVPLLQVWRSVQAFNALFCCFGSQCLTDMQIDVHSLFMCMPLVLMDLKQHGPTVGITDITH